MSNRQIKPQIIAYHAPFSDAACTTITRQRNNYYGNCGAIGLRIPRLLLVQVPKQDGHETLRVPQPEQVRRQQGTKVPNKVPNKLKSKFPNITDATWDVLSVLKTNKDTSAEDLGRILSISSRMVRKHIALLRESGLIVREGSNKTGYWRVTI